MNRVPANQPCEYDYAIIGAGMAGASIASEIGRLAPAGTRTVLLEAESQPGYHATGRSAAFWEQCYGGPQIVPLTLASGSYLRDHGFLKKRGAFYIGRAGDQAKLDRFSRRFAGSGAKFERIGRDWLKKAVPGLLPEWTDGIWQPDCADIDVAGLHQHYLSRARNSGVEVRTRFEVSRISHADAGWIITPADGDAITARVIVNAAGAWADTIADMAGVAPLGITPLRRTVVQLRIDPEPPASMPLVLDINGGFYFKPEAGRLWLSPHDETPSVPCDAAPEEADIAVAIDNLSKVADWRVTQLEHKWAGLRSFSPDRLPVYGRDQARSEFVWFAGQGGFGIQTAPAAARLVAQHLLGLAPDSLTKNIDPALYSPERFA